VATVNCHSRYDNAPVDGAKEAKQLMAALHAYEPGDSILELGCAAGYMRQFLPQPYFGLERSSTLVAKHLQVFGGQCAVGEANDLSRFEDKSFDHVVLFSVCQ
jgi:hypothetical protein